MGEFAGYALQETEEAEWDRFLFRRGEISHAQAYDAGIIDELGYEYSAYRPAKPLVCKHCGQKCRWVKTAAGWRTGELTGEIHKCPRFRK